MKNLRGKSKEQAPEQGQAPNQSDVIADNGGILLAEIRLQFVGNEGGILVKTEGGARTELGPFMGRFEKALDIFTRSLSLELQDAERSLISHQAELKQSEAEGRGTPQKQIIKPNETRPALVLPFKKKG